MSTVRYLFGGATPIQAEERVAMRIERKWAFVLDQAPQ
jgi:hypothetical protein